MNSFLLSSNSPYSNCKYNFKKKIHKLKAYCQDHKVRFLILRITLYKTVSKQKCVRILARRTNFSLLGHLKLLNASSTLLKSTDIVRLCPGLPGAKLREWICSAKGVVLGSHEKPHKPTQRLFID